MLSDFEAAFEGVEREVVRALEVDDKRSWGAREVLDLLASKRREFARDETAIEALFRRFGPELEALFTNKLFAQMLTSEQLPDQPATTAGSAEAEPDGMQGESGHRRSTPDGEENHGRHRGHARAGATAP